MAYYARNDFFHNPELIERSVDILRGKLTLDWMKLDIERVRCRPSHPDRGLAQLYTDLTCMVTLLEDVPSQWVWHIDHELVELKSWLCAQMFDAAQLADIFRKRAIAGGTGLGRDHAPLGELLKGVLDSGTYPCASAGAYILLSGLVQLLIRYLFSVRPHEKASLAGHLDELENLTVGLLGSPMFLSSLAVVTAGGRERAAEAVPRVVQLYRAFADEHAARRRAAGIPGDETPLSIFVRETLA